MNLYLARLLWCVGAALTLAAGAIWLYGCSPPKGASEPTVDLTLAVACSEVMNQAVEQSTTCPEAEKRINASAVCREIKPDGYDLKCHKDGGP
jgi:hypothetical protein